MRLDFQYRGSIKGVFKTIKRRYKIKYIYFFPLINDWTISRMLKSFKSKAAVVRDDTPERAFQGWIGRRRE